GRRPLLDLPAGQDTFFQCGPTRRCVGVGVGRCVSRYRGKSDSVAHVNGQTEGEYHDPSQRGEASTSHEGARARKEARQGARGERDALAAVDPSGLVRGAGCRSDRRRLNCLYISLVIQDTGMSYVCFRSLITPKTTKPGDRADVGGMA